MILQDKVDALHSANVIDKNLISDAYKSRIDSLSDDDIARLIEIANKLDPNRRCPIEISLLF
jgi:hypothetical protein